MTNSPNTAEKIVTSESVPSEVEFRYLSPPEYVRAANARDSREKHSIDLHHFLSYLQTNAGLLREMPEDKIDELISHYLDDAVLP